VFLAQQLSPSVTLGFPMSDCRTVSRASINLSPTTTMTTRLKKKLNDLGVDTSSKKANESFVQVHISPSFIGLG